MARLADMISCLSAIHERLGNDELAVCAKEDALVVRESNGNRTICFIRAAEGNQAVRIEWKGNWQQQIELECFSEMAGERSGRRSG